MEPYIILGLLCLLVGFFGAPAFGRWALKTREQDDDQDDRDDGGPEGGQ